MGCSICLLIIIYDNLATLEQILSLKAPKCLLAETVKRIVIIHSRKNKLVFHAEAESFKSQLQHRAY